MQPRILALSLAALLCGGSALAAETTFVGPQIGIGIGRSYNEVDYDGFVGNQSGNRDDLASDLRAGYGFAVSDRWVVNTAVTYDLNRRKFGSIHYAGGADSVDTRLKNHWSASVEPGYRVLPDVLVYGKLAYHSAQAEYSDTATGTGSRSHTGYGIGIGVSYVYRNAYEIGFEMQHVELSRQSANLSSGKPVYDEALLRLGYRF